MHEVLERLLWLPPEHRNLSTARDIAARVWHAWTELGAQPDLLALGLDQHQGDAFARWTWASIERAIGDVEAMTLVATELRVDIVLEGVPFRGFIDVVIEAIGNPDALEIADWKTGEKPEQGKPWTEKGNEEKLLQPLLYAAALREMGHEVQGVSLIYIPAEGRAGFLYADATAEAIDGALRALTAAYMSIEEATETDRFPTAPSALCGWCDFIAICPEGQAEVEARHAQRRNIGPAETILQLRRNP